MEAQSIQEYERLERYYWWFVGRRRIIESVLRKYIGGKLRILDWGCGPGGNFPFLKKYGDVLGVDASDEALSACRKKGITTIAKAQDISEFASNEKFDLITNFDVLEHIGEDEKFLRDIRELLNPRGYVLVTVPAYQFLWTGLDEVLGHKRRYTKKEITQKFRQSGYDVVMSSYFIFFLSPAFILFRMVEKLRKNNSSSLKESVLEFPRLINQIFIWLLSLEAFLMNHFSLPFGTSIIVLATRKS
jgi:2-polyprenyl-3-methyl-5-hydroxy-6-metoxy-1,4-benzoquinol methylase